jgi:tRNA-Thr(GGU) m(6)t(6)A37 methyltransferase TsaA
VVATNLRRVISLEPIGVVVGGRQEAIDDDWGAVTSIVRLEATRFDIDAVAGLEEFSHLCVVFHFHLVDESAEVTGARHPRGNSQWPKVGVFAQRAKMRPNRLGVSYGALERVEGLDLHVRGLDAIDGSPILDVKPYMCEFEPTRTHQPSWASELMQGYY